MSAIDRRRLLIKGSSAGILGLSGITLAEDVPAKQASPSMTGVAPPCRPAHEITPETFGASPDGLIDCSDAFEAALAAATRTNLAGGSQRNLILVLSSGAYRLTRTLVIPFADVTIIGNGATQSTLIIDHRSGPGVLGSSAMNLRFEHFSVVGSDDRLANGAGDGVVLRPAPNTNFTFRVTIENVSVSRHPGNGFFIANPEGLRMANVNSFGNASSGCVLDSTGLENICNLLDFTRFNDNGDAGLRVLNLANSIFSRVECLNNKGSVQFDLHGRHNTVTATDCECFKLYNGSTPQIGLRIRGRGHIVQQGIFFKLSTAIQLIRASNCRIILPIFGGVKGAPIHIAVDLDVDCIHNVIDVSGGEFIEQNVRDPSGNNVAFVNGRDPSLAASPKPLAALGSIEPDLQDCHTVYYTLLGPTKVRKPLNVTTGKQLTMIFDCNRFGLKGISFDPAYGGLADLISANKAQRYLTCKFVSGAEGELLLDGFVAYD